MQPREFGPGVLTTLIVTIPHRPRRKGDADTLKHTHVKLQQAEVTDRLLQFSIGALSMHSAHIHINSTHIFAVCATIVV